MDLQQVFLPLEQPAHRICGGRGGDRALRPAVSPALRAGNSALICRGATQVGDGLSGQRLQVDLVGTFDPPPVRPAWHDLPLDERRGVAPEERKTRPDHRIALFRQQSRCSIRGAGERLPADRPGRSARDHWRGRRDQPTARPGCLETGEEGPRPGTNRGAATPDGPKS